MSHRNPPIQQNVPPADPPATAARLNLSNEMAGMAILEADSIEEANVALLSALRLTGIDGAIVIWTRADELVYQPYPPTPGYQPQIDEAMEQQASGVQYLPP